MARVKGRVKVYIPSYTFIVYATGKVVTVYLIMKQKVNVLFAIKFILHCCLNLSLNSERKDTTSIIPLLRSEIFLISVQAKLQFLGTPCMAAGHQLVINNYL